MSALKLQVERRGSTPAWAGVVVPIGAAVVALLVAAILLGAAGHEPLSVYRQMFDVAFGSASAISSTLVEATPILFTGLAIAIAFRMNARNIGGEGQLYMGAAAAAAVGIALGGASTAVAIPAMVLAGALAGALWVLAPALLRVRFGTNELISTLMLNYVGALVLSYLIFDSTSYVRDMNSPAAMAFPQGRQIGNAAFWPAFTGGGFTVPLGFVIGTILALLLFITVRFTLFGFQLRAIGDSPSASRYAGIPTDRRFVMVMLLSGALAGLAGASQIGDFSHLLDPNGLTNAQFAWTGIVVAAVVGYNPLGVILSAFLIGGLLNAGVALEGSSFPLGLVGTIEGLILLGVACGLVLVRFRVTLRVSPQIRETGTATALSFTSQSSSESNP
jgi:general nucleoside transport system permease protein